MRKAEQKERAKEILRRIDRQIAKAKEESAELARASLVDFGGEAATQEDLKRYKGLELYILDMRTRFYEAWDVIEELGIMTIDEIHEYLTQLSRERRENKREQNGNTL